MQGILFRPDIWKAKKRVLEQYGEAQTRRLSGLKEINQGADDWWLVASFDDSTLFRFANDKLNRDLIIKPRYRVGQTVYVKEAYQVFGEHVHYRLDYPKDTVIWCSSMLMPEKYARDFIQFTDVRPERLQDITEEDCKAEGIIADPYEDWKVSGICAFWQSRYAELWDSIDKDYPWETNPWLMRYVFKQVER